MTPADLIHETVLCPGEMRELAGILLHCRGIEVSSQFTKDVDIAKLEARQLDARGKSSSALRVVWMPVARFFWCYIGRGAIRAGAAGLMYSLMRATVNSFARPCTGIWSGLRHLERRVRLKTATGAEVPERKHS